jgi:hypothetical protein
MGNENGIVVGERGTSRHYKSVALGAFAGMVFAVFSSVI